MTPGGLPIPPRTTITRIVTDTTKAKFSGLTRESLAP
jgi:hypothetical protein